MVVEVLPFAIATAVNVVYFRVAIIVTSLVAPAVQQGYFAASFRVIETLVLVPGLLVSSAFPIFSRAAHNDRDRLRYAVQRVYEAASALGVATALGLALGAPFVIEVVAGPDFKPAGPVLAVQAFALAATFPAVTWGYTLLSLRRHREMLLMNLFALGVAIVVTLVLASTHGARGAAWATVTGEVVLCLAAGFTLRRADRSMTPDLRNLPRLAVAAAAGAATALIGLPPLPTALLGVAVYLVVLWRIGGIPEEILVEVRRRFGRA
jgi:O-antigen/teichoic acid export membrane protein